MMNSFKALISGTIVYIAVASIHACGGSSPSSPATASVSGGEAGASSTGGRGGAGGLMDPVGDADAEESGSRLKARRLVASDGAKQFASFYDSLRKEVCFFGATYDGMTRCIPLDRASVSGLYYDSSCTIVVALWLKSVACGYKDVSYVEYEAPGQCGLHVYTAIKMTAGATVYAKSGSTCVPSGAPAEYDTYTAGPEVPVSSFVAASIVTDQ